MIAGCVRIVGHVTPVPSRRRSVACERALALRVHPRVVVVRDHAEVEARFLGERRLAHELVRRMIFGREREAELHQRFAAWFTPDFIRPPVAIFVRSVSAWLSSSSVWSSRSFASLWPSWSASVFAVPYPAIS